MKFFITRNEINGGILTGDSSLKLKFIAHVLIWISLQIFFSTYAFANLTNHYSYRVRAGETLSQILDQIGICPLYGKNNKLNQTIALNSSSIGKDGNFILMNRLIILPETVLKADPDYQILASREVVMVNIHPRSKCSSHKLIERRIANESESLQVTDINQDVLPVTEVPITPVADPTTDYLAHSSFVVGAGADYFKIEGIDSYSNGKTVILSNLSPSFKFCWNLEWDRKTTFSFSGGIQKYSLQPLSDGQSLNRNSGIRGSFSFSYARILSNRFSLGSGLNLNDELFFHAETPTVLSLDKVSVVSPIVFGRYTLLEKKNASIGALGEAGILLQGDANNYKIKTGFHTLGGLFLRHLPKKNNYQGIEGQLFYVFNKQDTSITIRKSSEMVFKLLYFWRLGE